MKLRTLPQLALLFLLATPVFADSCKVGEIMEVKIATGDWGTLQIMDLDDGRIKVKQVYGRDPISGKPAEMWYTAADVACRTIDPNAPSQFSKKYGVRLGDNVEVFSAGKWEPAQVVVIYPDGGAVRVYMPARKLEDHIETRDKIRPAGPQSAQHVQADIDRRKTELSRAFDACMARGLRAPTRTKGSVGGAPGREEIARVIWQKMTAKILPSDDDVCIILSDTLEYLPKRRYHVDWSDGVYSTVYPVRVGMTVLRREHNSRGVTSEQKGYDGKESFQTFLFFNRGGGWNYQRVDNW